MRAHVALEVEVGKLIGLLKLEKLGELGIRVDLATVLLILKIVGADVLVDLTGHLSAGHLSTSVLAEEGSELTTDKGGLDKTTRAAVASLALALAVHALTVHALTVAPAATHVCVCTAAAVLFFSLSVFNALIGTRQASPLARSPSHSCSPSAPASAQ